MTLLQCVPLRRMGSLPKGNTAISRYFPSQGLWLSSTWVFVSSLNPVWHNRLKVGATFSLPVNTRISLFELNIKIMKLDSKTPLPPSHSATLKKTSSNGGGLGGRLGLGEGN